MIADPPSISTAVTTPPTPITARSKGPARDVATIAVLLHDDQLGFVVTDRLGFISLDDVAAARYL